MCLIILLSRASIKGRKTCLRCKLEQDLLNFTIKRSAKDGHHSSCRKCSRAYNNKRHHELSDIQRENKKRKSKLWKEQNIESHNKYRREWARHKYHTSKAYNIQERLKAGVQDALFRQGGLRPSGKRLKHLGCSVNDLIAHLQAQFEEGMTWDNRSEWHIDHRRPCASFDLLDEEQQKMCFHYTNLQPMWAADNLLKSDQYDEETFSHVWTGERWEPHPPP